MISTSPFKLRKKARRRAERVRGQSYSREMEKLDSQDLKCAVRIGEKRQMLTRGNKRQFFGAKGRRVFADSSSCGFAAAVTRSFRCAGSIDLFIALFRGKVLSGSRTGARLKLDCVIFGDTKSQDQYQQKVDERALHRFNG
jgi:hypothetical protein